MFRLVQQWYFRRGFKESKRFKSIQQSLTEHLWMPVTGWGLRDKTLMIIPTSSGREAPSS